MTRRITAWAIIATCILGWWLPQVNTGLRYSTFLILLGYTGIAVVRARRNTVFRHVAAVCGAGSIWLLFVPSWTIPLIASAVILLTETYLDGGLQAISDPVYRGRLPAAPADQGDRDDQRRERPTATASSPGGSPDEPDRYRQQSRQLEPDLDTTSLRNDTWR